MMGRLEPAPAATAANECRLCRYRHNAVDRASEGPGSWPPSARVRNVRYSEAWTDQDHRDFTEASWRHVGKMLGEEDG